MNYNHLTTQAYYANFGFPGADNIQEKNNGHRSYSFNVNLPWDQQDQVTTFIQPSQPSPSSVTIVYL